MISAETVAKAGLKLIGQISKMPAAHARALLSEPGRDFSEEEIAELLTLAKPEAAVQAKAADYYTQRRLVLAALWLLGASWSQLAALYETSRQSIMESANRLLRANRSRLATKCSYERLSEHNTQAWKSIDTLLPLTPHEAAAWLVTNTETDKDD